MNSLQKLDKEEYLATDKLEVKLVRLSTHTTQIRYQDNDSVLGTPSALAHDVPT